MWLSPAKNAEQMFKRDFSGKGLGYCSRKNSNCHCCWYLTVHGSCVHPVLPLHPFQDIFAQFCQLITVFSGCDPLIFYQPFQSLSDPGRIPRSQPPIPCKSCTYSSTAWTRMTAYDTKWHGKKRLVFSVILDLIWCKNLLKSQGGPTG